MGSNPREMEGSLSKRGSSSYLSSSYQGSTVFLTPPSLFVAVEEALFISSNFLKFELVKFLSPGVKMVFKYPTLGSYCAIKCPNRTDMGKISGKEEKQLPLNDHLQVPLCQE